MRWEAAQSKPNLANDKSEDGEKMKKTKYCSVKQHRNMTEMVKQAICMRKTKCVESI